MNVLWYARHQPELHQIKELKLVLGSDVNVIYRSGTIDNAIKIKQLMESNNCDELIAILPFTHYADLLELGIQPIRPIS